MKHSAGGTSQCGMWSKAPDVLSSRRSNSASMMDGAPSLPGMLLIIFLIIVYFIIIFLSKTQNVSNFILNSHDLPLR